MSPLSAPASAESLSCKVCPQGEYQDARGQVQCEKCAAGQYRNGENALHAMLRACTECQPGQYQSQPGQLACVKCAAGRFWNASAGASSAYACSDCAPDYYQDLEGQTTCAACATGEFTAGVAAQTACVVQPTPAPTPSPTQSPTPAPTPNPTPAPGACDNSPGCGPGAFCDQSADLCTPCEPGYFQGVNLTASNFLGVLCQPCPADTFAADTGSAVCTGCASTHHTNGAIAQTACIARPTRPINTHDG